MAASDLPEVATLLVDTEKANPLIARIWFGVRIRGVGDVDIGWAVLVKPDVPRVKLADYEKALCVALWPDHPSQVC